jgi:hypothetical protein
MCDPLTGLGLASNIVQLVTFTGSLISKPREIPNSENGSLVENPRVRGHNLKPAGAEQRIEARSEERWNVNESDKG